MRHGFCAYSLRRERTAVERSPGRHGQARFSGVQAAPNRAAPPGQPERNRSVLDAGRDLHRALHHAAVRRQGPGAIGIRSGRLLSGLRVRARRVHRLGVRLHRDPVDSGKQGQGRRPVRGRTARPRRSAVALHPLGSGRPRGACVGPEDDPTSRISPAGMGGGGGHRSDSRLVLPWHRKDAGDGADPARVSRGGSRADLLAGQGSRRWGDRDGAIRRICGRQPGRGRPHDVPRGQVPSPAMARVVRGNPRRDDDLRQHDLP